MSRIGGVVFLLDDVVFDEPMIGYDDRQGVSVRAGLLDLLLYLHDCQIPTALASTTDKGPLEASLARADIAGFFDVVVGESQRRGVLEPVDVLYEAATLLGVPRPRLLVLGASALAIGAGRLAGAVTVLVAGEGQYVGASATKAHAYVSELGEVIDLIEEGQTLRR